MSLALADAFENQQSSSRPHGEPSSADRSSALLIAGYRYKVAFHKAPDPEKCKECSECFSKIKQIFGGPLMGYYDSDGKYSRTAIAARTCFTPQEIHDTFMPCQIGLTDPY